MAILKFLKNYNNYANRIIKHDVLVKDMQGFETVDIYDINFNPADGITTKQIINWDVTWKPDYLIVQPDNAEDHFDPNYMSEYLNYVQVTDGSSNVLYTASSSTPNVVRNQMITDGLMTAVTKAVNLYNLANYHNENYSLNKMTFEGSWELNKFSLKVVDSGEWNFRIWSDENDLTIAHSDFPSDGIISKDFLAQKGWDITDATGVWGFEFIASSPDAFDGEATFSDFITKLNIESRWFVIDFDRKRAKQYNASLKKDVIADNYDAVINSPVLIERAMINDIEDPLLYNPEGFSFNQIKKSETKLMDNSKTPWYVLYFKKGVGNITGSFNPASIACEEIPSPLASSIYNPGTYFYVQPRSTSCWLEYRHEAGGWAWAFLSNKYRLTVYNSGPVIDYKSYSAETEVYWFTQSQSYIEPRIKDAFSGSYTSLSTKLLNDIGYGSSLSNDTYNKLNSARNGIYIKDSDNKIWYITVSINTENKSGYLTSGSCRQEMVTRVNGSGVTVNGTPGSRAFGYNAGISTLVVNATPVNPGAINWTLDWGNYQQTTDSDFNIITIPYETVTLVSSGNKTISKDVSNMFVQSITQSAASNLVDIQLLPYCPIQESINASGNIDATLVDSKLLYNVNNDYNQGILALFVQNSNYSFNITNTLNVPSYGSLGNAVSYKISNECDLYKIVSPNFNGSFEFSLAKNQGINYFNIDVTLIPYNPYIHINPNFKKLYGEDFDDTRGLICGGDFSLPRYSDAWAEYELQNKNYQQIFDRQVRNLDYINKQEQVASNWQFVTGTVQGTTQGAMTGGLVGGGWGAVAGGIIGGGTSLAGGIADSFMLTERQSENKNMVLDNYRYQLGNIKALPDTINKVTPITYNNKKFPILEYYSATDREKDLFLSYLEYRSMRIDKIDYIYNYLQSERTFIKATPLRIEGVDLSAVEMLEIFNELKKGVYI